jgi:dihydropteroate synthase
VAAERHAFVVLMHMQGIPRTMQSAPHYEDVVEEVLGFLNERVREAVRGGVVRQRLFIDPGIGFGKCLEHNLTLLRNVHRFAATGIPVLVGVSRKSFLGELLDLPASDRLEGTLAAEAVAVASGADVLRVHDVREGRRVADVARRLRRDAN